MKKAACITVLILILSFCLGCSSSWHEVCRHEAVTAWILARENGKTPEIVTGKTRAGFHSVCRYIENGEYIYIRCPYGFIIKDDKGIEGMKVWYVDEDVKDFIDRIYFPEIGVAN